MLAAAEASLVAKEEEEEGIKIAHIISGGGGRRRKAPEQADKRWPLAELGERGSLSLERHKELSDSLVRVALAHTYTMD